MEGGVPTLWEKMEIPYPLTQKPTLLRMVNSTFFIKIHLQIPEKNG